jgi:hypothetical protein
VTRPALGPTPSPMQWVARAPYLGRPGREADHSSPSSFEVKNGWSCTSTPQYVFMACGLVKHRAILPIFNDKEELFSVSSSALNFMSCYNL